MMKKILFILFASFLFSGCQKEEPALLTVVVPAIDFEMQTVFINNSEYYVFPVDGPFVAVNIAQQIQDAGYELSEINEIVPRQAELSANFNEERLDFIRAMSVRVCQSLPSNDICGQEVFYRDPLPENPGFSELFNPSATGDVKDVVLTNGLFVQLYLEQLWFNPPRNFTVRLDMEFSVR